MLWKSASRGSISSAEMTIVGNVARRYAARALTYVVKNGPVLVDVFAYDGSVEVGNLTLRRPHLPFRAPLTEEIARDSVCRRNAEALKEEVFGGRNVAVWVVGDVGLDTEYRGMGLGEKLYEHAFKIVAPAIIIPDKCDSGRTSVKAARVWRKLRSKYPSKGRKIEDLAIAVR